MSDKDLTREILLQIRDAIDTVRQRFAPVANPDYFTSSPQGVEKLDAICMQLIAIGESLKNLDKITQGRLLKKYPQIDWRGAMGMRDIIVHHYFDIDSEAIFDVCAAKIGPLAAVIEQMLKEI